MKPIYTQTFQISDLHVNCTGRLRPSAILFFAQEAAGQHCKELSLDWETLASKGLFWAVLRHRVQITRLPTRDETITVETWPMPTTRSAFPRSTRAVDQNGNELFRCISLWVLMDMHKRTMVLPGKSGVLVEGSLRGTELLAPGSIAPKAMEYHRSRCVSFTDLDRNLHMNNTRYLDWIADLLPAQFHQEHPLKEFVLCYLSEAREAEELTLHYQLTDGPCLEVDADRKAENGEEKPTRVFSAQLLF